MCGTSKADTASDFVPSSNAPGTYHIEFGGWRKLAVDQITNQLEGRALDYFNSRYVDSKITLCEFNDVKMRLGFLQTDYENGKWFEKRLWEYSDTHTSNVIIEIGHTEYLLNTPLFYLRTDGDFKIRSVELFIDTVKAEVFVNPIEHSSSGFKISIRPIVSFGSTNIQAAPVNFVRSLGIQSQVVYYRNGAGLLRFFIAANYSPRDKSSSLEFQISFIQW